MSPSRLWSVSMPTVHVTREHAQATSNTQKLGRFSGPEFEEFRATLQCRVESPGDGFGATMLRHKSRCRRPPSGAFPSTDGGGCRGHKLLHTAGSTDPADGAGIGLAGGGSVGSTSVGTSSSQRSVRLAFQANWLNSPRSRRFRLIVGCARVSRNNRRARDRRLCRARRGSGWPGLRDHLFVRMHWMSQMAGPPDARTRNGNPPCR